MPAKLSPYRVFVAPGLDNSGPDHWQSRWQRLYPTFQRIEQRDWSTPDLPAWSGRVDAARQVERKPTLIVAHSFGCLASVRSVAHDPEHVAGLLLVAPADPDKFGVADLLPHDELPCPAIVIASSNDPWMPLERARAWAERWGATFVEVGALGHINAESGLGDWLFGQQQLQTLAERAHNALSAY
ncbi:RBBP9/YdeN family alpha/beta hydrolase [Pseudoduganella armeniaca]|uniref:Alpha/beta hydrolase n=1 Tax=Pseudoduganella armeniaca TaxID=2072590 RepID=A0A2R4CF06_9BURK|nr:alpha/beta hydrolase [Pseudoduganella armeniaca]AVR98221.1 alpha/beta hydrolase [Pseudoduganella armeniaca]